MNETIRNRISIKISARRLMMILPGLFYLANLVRMLMISTTPYYITLFFVGAAGILAMIVSNKNYYIKIIAFFFIYGITLIFNWLIIRNVSINGIAISFFLVGITFLMLMFPWGYKTGVFVFYSTALLIIYSMSISPTRHILVSSSNYISVVLLLAVSFYYIAIDLEGRKLTLIDIIPAFVCFDISVWARGRGGILSMAVLFVSVLFLYLKNKTADVSKRVIIIFGILLIILVIGIIRNTNLISAFMTLGKWQTKGTDNSARLIVWKSYFSYTLRSVIYVFFGAPLQNIPVIVAFNGNCHNSFLQLHAYNGLLMLVLFFGLLIKSFKYYWKNGLFVMLVMLLVFVIRALSDKFVFSQYGMPIMLFFVLYPIVKSDKN